MLEIVQKQRDERYLLFNILVIDRGDTDDSLAWCQKQCATAHHHWLVINEVLRDLRLFKDILISADMHADEAELVRMLPAASHGAVERGEQLLDRLNVLGECRIHGRLWDGLKRIDEAL